jgi:preprotein translocase subunit SecD
MHKFSATWQCLQSFGNNHLLLLRNSALADDTGMKRTVCLFLSILAVTLHAQAQLTVRAASDEAVAGWQRMPTEDNKTIWVSPTTSLTASDFESMTPYVNPGDIWFMKIVLTDDGAAKMRALSIAQMNKLIALVLDGKVIWAPKVRSEIGKTVDFTGSGPHGLEMDLIRRLSAIVPPAGARAK